MFQINYLQHIQNFLARCPYCVKFLISQYTDLCTGLILMTSLNINSFHSDKNFSQSANLASSYQQNLISTHFSSVVPLARLYQLHSLSGFKRILDLDQLAPHCHLFVLISSFVVCLSLISPQSLVSKICWSSGQLIFFKICDYMC